MTTMHRWVAGAVAAALVLIATAWFLLISPQRSQAAELREQAAAQQDANDAIRLKTQQLKGQFASLPQRQAQLAEIQQQLPSAPNLPTLIRQLSTIADDARVSVDSIAPAPPQPLAVATPGATAGTSAPSGTSTATGSSAGASAATPAAVAGVQSIATTIVVKGSYAELTLFLQKVQGSMRRAVLVENLTLVPGDSVSQTSTTSDTPLTMTLTTKVFVLASAATNGTTAGAAAAATANPTTK